MPPITRRSLQKYLHDLKQLRAAFSRPELTQAAETAQIIASLETGIRVVEEYLEFMRKNRFALAYARILAAFAKLRAKMGTSRK